MDSEQSLPSALGHPGGLACQVPGRAWLRPPRTRTGRLALTFGRVACQRHPIQRHEIGSENRCRWTLRMCMASHIYEYTQQTTHRVATNTTRRPLFHRAPEDEDDRGAHSKAKEFILGISVCCLCFLKLVNLDLDLYTLHVEKASSGRPCNTYPPSHSGLGEPASIGRQEHTRIKRTPDTPQAGGSQEVTLSRRRLRGHQPQPCQRPPAPPTGGARQAQ